MGGDSANLKSENLRPSRRGIKKLAPFFESQTTDHVLVALRPHSSARSQASRSARATPKSHKRAYSSMLTEIKTGSPFRVFALQRYSFAAASSDMGNSLISIHEKSTFFGLEVLARPSAPRSWFFVRCFASQTGKSNSIFLTKSTISFLRDLGWRLEFPSICSSIFDNFGFLLSRMVAMQTDSGSTPFLFIVVRKGLSFTPTLNFLAPTRWELFPTVSFTFRSPFGERVRPRLAAPPPGFVKRKIRKPTHLDRCPCTS